MRIAVLYSEQPFAKRLGMLIGFDMAITLLYSFVPENWTVVRGSVAMVTLLVMAVTMVVALGRLLSDF